jgi:hypothetical protein
MVGGKTPIPFLMATGSDAAIAIQMFDLDAVRAAAAPSGWRFVDDPRR